MDIIKYFLLNKIFIRVIITDKYTILWNDYDILIRIDNNDLLKYNNIIINASKIRMLDQINSKYSKNNNMISVIIPNYNNEIHIQKTILSILENSYKNIEIIFIDDCSTDKSLEIVLNYFGNNNRVKIYANKENKGTYYCRNIGILMSSGYYIGFVDGDDYILPDKYDYEIKNLETINKNNIKYWGYGTGFNRIHYKDNINNITKIKRTKYYNYIFYRKLFNLVGYYNDNRFGADTEFIRRSSKYGYDLYKDKNAVFYNAYTTEGKNLTQIYNKRTRMIYLQKCRNDINNNNYIQMALLDDPEFIKKVIYYKNNRLQTGVQEVQEVQEVQQNELQSDNL